MKLTNVKKNNIFAFSTKLRILLIFIDELLENVQAAEYSGMRGIHCEDFEHVEKKLSELAVF